MATEPQHHQPEHLVLELLHLLNVGLYILLGNTVVVTQPLVHPLALSVLVVVVGGSQSFLIPQESGPVQLSEFCVISCPVPHSGNHRGSPLRFLTWCRGQWMCQPLAERGSPVNPHDLQRQFIAHATDEVAWRGATQTYRHRETQTVNSPQRL